MPLAYIPVLLPLLVFALLAVIGVLFCLAVARPGSRINLERLERASKVWRTIAWSPFHRRDDPD